MSSASWVSRVVRGSGRVAVWCSLAAYGLGLASVMAFTPAHAVAHRGPTVRLVRHGGESDPTLDFFPASGDTFSSASQELDVVSCDDYTLSSTYSTITLNGTDVKGSFSIPTDQPYTCGEGGVDIIGTVTLASGSNTLTANICNIYDQCTEQSATYTYSATPVLDHVTVTLTSSPVADDDPDGATAKAYDTNDDLMTGQTFTYSSSNTGVATIDGSGTITAVAPGTTTITATDGSKNATADLTVQVGGASSVTVSVSPDTIDIGDYSTATATAKDSKGYTISSPTVSWSSSNTGVATVSGTGTTGTITGAGAGSATITATVQDVPGTGTITVEDPTPTITIWPGTEYTNQASGFDIQVTGCSPVGISYSSITITLNSVNVTTDFTRTGSSFTCRDYGYEWDSSSLTLSAGANTLDVTLHDSGGHESDAGVTYTYYVDTLTSVTVSPKPVSLVDGHTQAMTATAYNQHGIAMSGQTFSWVSRHTDVATVNASSGLVTAVAAGSTYVVATDGPKSDSALVTVSYGTPAHLVITSPHPTIGVDSTDTLTAVITDSSGVTIPTATADWTASSGTIATLSATSETLTTVATGAALGRDTITAAVHGHTAVTGTTVVTVAGSVQSVAFTIDTLPVAKGGYATIHALAEDTNGIVVPWATFTWTISPSNASVYRSAGDSAVVLGVTAGQASIIAESNGHADTAIVMVTDTGSDGGGGGGGTCTINCSDTLLVWAAIENPDSAIVRDHCLTIAAGDAGAYECGDLRLAHALPGVTTYGVTRAPVLTYNSAQASLQSVIHANVFLNVTSGSPPTSLQATVEVDGHQLAQDTVAWNSACLAHACRLNVPVNGDSVSGSGTAAHSYTFEVKTIGGTSYTATDTGVVIFVDRRTSMFGTGWWLDGFEQLSVIGSDSTHLLWVGGDGSARIYTEQSDSVWTAPNVDHPDSLLKQAGGYARRLRNNGDVLFNLMLQDSATVNSLGHATTFHYGSGGRLAAIDLPVPSGSAAKVDSFFYHTPTGGHLQLDSVRAAPIGTVQRVTKILYNTSGADTSMTDPDGTTVHFHYGADTVTRINRLGDATTYTLDAAGGLAKTVVNIKRTNPADSLMTTTYCAAETAGYNACGTGLLPLDSAYTYVNGPRQDTTVFHAWVNRYGAPSKLLDALGGQTVINYDSTWSGLAAQVTDPMAHVVQAYYNPRGDPDSVMDVNPLDGVGSSAVTRYQYASNSDWLTKITEPEGDFTLFTVNDTTGNRLTAEDGRGALSQVSFVYGGSAAGAAKRMLVSVTRPDGAKDSLVYDSLGNVSATRTPLGAWSYSYGDAIGRPAVVLTPVDSAGSLMRRDSTVYDLMSRVTDVYHFGPSTSYIDRTQSDATITVPALIRHDSTEYDLAGHPIEVMVPMDSEAPVLLTDVQYTYDAAGRKISEARHHGGTETLTYDAAGNLTSKTTPRGYTISYAYDAMNRLTTRTAPSVTVDTTSDLCPFAYHDVELCANHSFELPLFGDTVVVIPGDTATFQYDAAGRLTEADNHAAHVTRTWNLNGTLASETQALRVYTESEDSGAPFSRHVYALTYQYDLDGRRTALIRDSGLLPEAECASGQWNATIGGCAQTSQYTTDAGFLDQVTDPWGGTYGFVYDSTGRLIVHTAPGGMTDSTWYDVDGRDTVRAQYSGSSLINHDVYHRNAPGQIIWAHAEDGAVNTYVSYAYDGLGAVVATQSAPSDDAYPSIERFQVDPLGRVVARSAADATGDSSSAVAVYSTHGGQYDQLLAWQGGPGIPGAEKWTQLPLDSTAMTYDADGNRVDAWEHQFAWNGTDQAQEYAWDDVTRNYYDAEDQLRLLARQGLASNRSSAPRQEEYWYDALGRRVLVRSMADSDSAGYHEAIAASTLTRTVWDGAQVLDEDQGWGRMGASASVLEEDGYGQDSTINSTQHPYGHVAYVVGGLDAPLAFKRAVGATAHVLVPFINYRGVADTGVTSTGDASDADILWPGNDRATYWNLEHTLAGVGWAGSQIASAQDESGLLYKRNRYYDAASGQFTQEDPLGLGGGMNLYGFVNGDPINASDPFGDSTFVGCRPLHGAVGAEGNHCGVGVGENGSYKWGELLKDNGTNRVDSLQSVDALPDNYKWTAVATPSDETMSDFDNAVIQSFYFQRPMYAGQTYTMHSLANSNHFIFSVITGAGGKIPRAAVPKHGYTPGLCGGAATGGFYGYLALGNGCSN